MGNNYKIVNNINGTVFETTNEYRWFDELSLILENIIASKIKYRLWNTNNRTIYITRKEQE